MTEPRYETPERAEAARLRALYAATISDLRGNQDLKPQVRDQQIKDLHAEGRQRLDRLREADRQRLSAEHAKKSRELFSGLRRKWNAPEVDMISVRDAMDRAEVLRSPAEAAALLHRAQTTGDKALESAVAAVAVDRAGDGPAGDAWAGVAQAYIDADPDYRQPLAQRLAELEDLVDPTAAPLSRVLGDEFSIAAPPEARGGGFGDSVGGQPTPSVGTDAAPSVHS